MKNPLDWIEDLYYETGIPRLFWRCACRLGRHHWRYNLIRPVLGRYCQRCDVVQTYQVINDRNEVAYRNDPNYMDVKP